MNVFSVILISDIHSPFELSDQSIMNKANLSNFSARDDLQKKIGSEIISGKTTLTTDKDHYSPGEWVTINAESSTDEMNGSLEWQLESPISEIAFDFKSNFQDIFLDRKFQNTSVLDWENVSFDIVESPLGYLNLTETPDLDEDDAEIFYNTTALESGKYVISFDYFSQGQNLILNPGFEGGYTTGWDFNSSYVEAVEDPDNASEGSYYANINGSEGELINQTVSFLGGSRDVTFSARATGVTNDNFWYIRLEAFNSSGHSIGETQSTDSLDGTPDDKGYVTKILSWKTPENTTELHVEFFGSDIGDDNYYTGWLDECYLYEDPPSLIFSYWGENDEWKEKELTVGTHKWENATFRDVDMNINSSKTFRLILPDDNSYSNNATSYWLIDNFAVNLVTVPEEEWDEHYPIINTEDSFSGYINSTWFHQGLRENISSTFDVVVEAPENVTTPSECHATIRVQLPMEQVYFGSWIFVYQIHRIQDGTWVSLDTISINISFIVQEPMNYIIQDSFMYRGYTNKTVGNETVFTEHFEKETNVEAISPGDNVTLIGYLEANSTKGEWYNLDYLQIGSASVEYRWNSNWQSRENITWTEFGFITYDKKGETILDGNFTSPHNNVRAMALNFRIPRRGIFGNLSANLTITLTGTNMKPNGVGGAPLVLTIPLDLPPVKFKVNVIEENLPESDYYLTDYLDGNITLKFLNFNDTLEEAFPNRTITSNLSIPMKDIELTIFLDNQNQTPNEIDISQHFHHQYVGNTVLWLDPVAPHLLSGTYSFRIRWNAPFLLEVHDQEELIVAHFIEIKGSLLVIPGEQLTEIQQGGQKTINFSVHLDNDTGKKVGGLDLIGIINSNQSYGNLIIYEEEGLYKIDLDIEFDFPPDKYTIEVFIIDRADPIEGMITYQVTERPEPPKDTPTPLDQIINLGGFIFFILVSFGVIGALYWANKTLK